MEINVRKGAGQIEPFSKQKLEKTLHRAGVDTKKRHKIITQIFKDSPVETTTEQIHHHAFEILKQEDPASAARYNLRQAIMELGPSGYPFEQYVASLLDQLDYQVQTNQIIDGACVTHEVDVVAVKDNTRAMIECKYHNHRGARSDVKTALYIWARFEDLHEKWEQIKSTEAELHEAWIVTNTKVTTDAQQYAQCKGIKVVSWARPSGHSLQDMILSTGLWPVTCLSTLTQDQKRKLVEGQIILCHDLAQADKHVLKQLDLPNLKPAIEEAQFICQIPSSSS